ncbi:MAG: hypothetical protein KKH83_05875, partial [Candidatus Margulisbacteria bacterium]|nr:hypothetical protein [Candidatus Margulisiibacteriota bacterium]
TSMISSGKKNGTANVILPGGKVLKSNIEVDYEPEQITISGRQIRSYRAKTTFDLGMLSIFSPTLQFWFMADAPYFFLRYMGPGSSPGSSDIIQEVVNL